MKFKRTRRTGGMVVELCPQEAQLPQLSPARSEPRPPLFRLKNILVPVDFADPSKKALVYARGLARQFGAEVTLLHVLEPYPTVPQMDPLDLNAIQDALEQLEELRKSLDGTVPSQTLLRVGIPHSEIARAAEELSSDLIILWTRGRTGLAHVFLGGTVDKVTRHAPCPILIVREQERDFLSSSAVSGRELVA